MRRSGAICALVTSFVLSTSGLAWARPGAQPGFDEPGFPPLPGWFVAFGVLAVAVGIGSFLLRVSAARSMARRAGIDEDAAAAVTLFDEHGLTATYLAGNLRAPGSGVPPSGAEARLRELRRLLDAGLITQTEHDERRRQVLDQL